MTKDDIIRMACKADNIHINCEGYLPEPDEESMEEFLVAFANLVAAAEREECALVAMEFRRGAGSPVCADVASAIRARSQS